MFKYWWGEKFKSFINKFTTKILEDLDIIGSCKLKAFLLFSIDDSFLKVFINNKRNFNLINHVLENNNTISYNNLEKIYLQKGCNKIRPIDSKVNKVNHIISYNMRFKESTNS